MILWHIFKILAEHPSPLTMDLLYILLAFLLDSFVKHYTALLSVNICLARPVLLVS